MNFCKWIPKAENGTWKLFFGSVILEHGKNMVTETFNTVKSYGLYSSNKAKLLKCTKHLMVA